MAKFNMSSMVKVREAWNKRGVKEDIDRSAVEPPMQGHQWTHYNADFTHPVDYWSCTLCGERWIVGWARPIQCQGRQK